MTTATGNGREGTSEKNLSGFYEVLVCKLALEELLLSASTLVGHLTPSRDSRVNELSF